MKKFIVSILVSVVLITLSFPIHSSAYNIESAEISSVRTISFGEIIEVGLDEERQAIVFHAIDIDYTTEKKLQDVELYFEIVSDLGRRMRQVDRMLGDNPTSHEKMIQKYKFYRSEEYIRYRDNYTMEIYLPYSSINIENTNYIDRSRFIQKVMFPAYVGERIFYELDENNTIIEISNVPMT